MIRQHAAIARSLAEQLGLSGEVLDAVGAAYEQWDGRGWPGELEGPGGPIAARVAQLAEFVEVAHRVGGVGAAKALARRRGGKQFDPELAELVSAEGDMLFSGGLDGAATWDAVIDAEPALAVVLSGERFDAALLAIANFVDLKSPYTSATRRRRGPRRRGRHAARALRRGVAHAAPGRSGARPRPAGRLELDLGQARTAGRRRVGARADAPLPDRAHAAPVGGAGAARRDRRAAPRAPRRLGLSARALRRRDLPPGADPRRRGRLPGDARAAPAPRPRPADEAAAELRADVKAGRLDAEAVEAVLGAAGHRVLRRREGPAG